GARVADDRHVLRRAPVRRQGLEGQPTAQGKATRMNDFSEPASLAGAYPFHACSVKQLPEHKLIEAARIAIAHNPANGINFGDVARSFIIGRLVRDDVPVTDSERPQVQRIAAIVGKYWSG